MLVAFGRVPPRLEAERVYVCSKAGGHRRHGAGRRLGKQPLLGTFAVESRLESRWRSRVPTAFRTAVAAAQVGHSGLLELAAGRLVRQKPRVAPGDLAGRALQAPTLHMGSRPHRSCWRPGLASELLAS